LTSPLHILVGDKNARKVCEGLRCHISSGTFPRGSFIRGGDGLLVSSPELCFMQMASELSFIDLVSFGYELCGGYRLDKASGSEDGFRKDIPLTDASTLSSFVDRATGLKGRTNARKALRFITDSSASPMETALTLLLVLPYRLGGYGFPLPRLNCPIDVGVNAKKTVSRSSKLRFYADLYWPDEQVDVEYDSDAWHLEPEQKARDSERGNALLSAGVAVLTVSRKQIVIPSRMRMVAEELSKLLGKRLQYPLPEFTMRNFALLQQLLP